MQRPEPEGESVGALIRSGSRRLTGPPKSLVRASRSRLRLERLVSITELGRLVLRLLTEERRREVGGG